MDEAVGEHGSAARAGARRRSRGSGSSTSGAAPACRPWRSAGTWATDGWVGGGRPVARAWPRPRGRRLADAGISGAAIAADAQTDDLVAAAGDGRPFDAAHSRFGVMFFSDPPAAFANIARCLRPGGRFAASVWKDLSANDWMAVPTITAIGPLGVESCRCPSPAPGSVLAGRPRPATELLGGAGFVDVEVDPVDSPFVVAPRRPTGDRADAARRSAQRRVRRRRRGDVARRPSTPSRPRSSRTGPGTGTEIPAGSWTVTARVRRSPAAPGSHDVRDLGRAERPRGSPGWLPNLSAVPNDDDRGDGRFAELLAHAGVDEDLVLRSTFGFMAFHGGSLEEMTDVVAAAAAAQAARPTTGSVSPRTCNGTCRRSTVDPAQSPRLQAFLDHVDVVITVHGYGREGRWTELLAGGTNRALARRRRPSARVPRCPTTRSSPTSTRSPASCGASTPATRSTSRRGGVQLELPPRVRGRSPLSPPPGPDGLSPPTAALIDGLAEVARSWVAEVGTSAAARRGGACRSGLDVEAHEDGVPALTVAAAPVAVEVALDDEAGRR